MKSLKMLLAVAALSLVAGCHSYVVEPGNEGVIVDNPFIVGSQGVRENTQKPGLEWYWISTTIKEVAITPVKYDEPLEHLATNDNNFINYASYIVLQWHEPALMVKTFGYKDWYTTNLKEQYRTIVRDVTKKYQMTQIMIDPATLAAIEKEIADQFRAHIKNTGLHVTLLNVNMGKALPDAAVISEMNNTAVAQQRIKTEGQRKLSEDARIKAEQSRAAADNAYRESMHLDASQFVQLEAIKRYSHACETSKSGCVIVQGNTPVMIGK